MKKLIATLLGVSMICTALFAVAGCKEEKKPPVDDDPPIVDPVYTAPVVTVTPATMEITVGDEVSLLYGVTVTDEYDSDLRAVVSNDGGFDAEVAGEYTVTYSATNSKGKTGTATRVYTVVAPLPGYVLEVQKENDKANWVDKLGKEEKKMVFANEDYHALTEDTAFTETISGIFHNTSDETITVTVAGGSGESAILNAAGVVIEARDGANGKLVNKDNPSRPASTVTQLTYTDENGESQTGTVQSLFASYMQVPAGGFAIVVQHLGNFDEDGAGWLNKNLVYKYGAAAKIYTDDEKADEITVYADQAPVILTKPNVSIRVGNASADVQTLVTEGITYFDDNGTFDISDDVTSGLTVEVVGGGTPAFDVQTEGTYVYTLKLTDGNGNVTEFTRNVVVTPAEPTMPTIVINGEWYEFDEQYLGVNPETVEKPGTYEAIIYTSYFAGDYFVNNFGAYFIVGADGKINEVYSVWANKIFTLDENNQVVGTAGTQQNVLSQVKLDKGEYVVLAVNGGANGAAFRNTLGTLMKEEKQYMLGMSVELALIDYLPKVTVTKTDASVSSYSGANIVVNQVVTAGEASKASFLVYEHGSVESVVCNGWGIAIVTDAEGKIVKVYDGVNNKYYDVSNPDGVPAGDYFKAASYATDAYAALAEGETLIIFPNDGVNNANSPRTWALNHVRKVGATISFSNFGIPETENDESSDFVITKADGAKAKYTPQSVIRNQEVTATEAAKAGLLIYEYGSVEKVNCNGYGVAIVINAEGKIVKIYDGANGKYYDESNSGGVAAGSYFAAGTYASDAYNALAEGETLIVFPHSGTDPNPRAWALSNVRVLGATVTLPADAPAPETNN